MKVPTVICFSHTWVAKPYSGRGPASWYRYCSACGRKETLLFDYETNKNRWVEGMFVPPEEKFLIVSASMHNFVRLRDGLFSKYDSKINVVWLSSQSVFEYVADVREPIIITAADWMDSEIVHDYRFRKLIETGRIV